MASKSTLSYLFVILFLFLNLPRYSAQSISASDVPKLVMKSFDKKYSFAKHIQWKSKGANYEAVIKDTLYESNTASTEVGTFNNAIITTEIRYQNTIVNFDSTGTLLLSKDKLMVSDTIIFPKAMKDYLKTKNIIPSVYILVQDYLVPAFFYDAETKGKTYRFLVNGTFLKEW